MSIEDLEKHGVLLPKEEWGTHDLTTTTAEVPLLIAFLVSVAGAGLTFWGAGGMWTWIGISIFFAAFVLVIVLCDRAIKRQNARVQQERERKLEDGAS